MKNQCINELHRFDIRDHTWSLVSRRERDIRVHILGVSDGLEFGTEPYTDLFVTFRNFRLNWANRYGTDVAIPLSFAQAMDRFGAEPYFVFSYGLDEDGIELCGLGSNDALALNFSFDEALIGWDNEPIEHIGELTVI